MDLATARRHRAEMLASAKTMAFYAGDTRLPSGYRYEAAVIGDHCLDVAKECDAFIREHLQRS